jgi:acyl carrier protein phosphodiesterase
MDLNTSTSGENAQNTSDLPQGDDSKLNQYVSFSKEQLLELLVQREEKLHEVNNESKQRKLKLRELESQQEQLREQSLKEKEEYKTLYEDLKKQTADYGDLKTFKESIAEHNALKLVELEKQLTAIEREELKILGELGQDTKMKWIELKLKSRNIANIDNSSSTVAGGILRTKPQNRRELALLSTQEQKRFKEMYPSLFNEAINKK